MHFFNRCFDKNRLKALILWLLNQTDEYTTLEIIEKLKDIGFLYATRGGLSLSIEDLQIPPQKSCIVGDAENLVESHKQEYLRGTITSIERIQQLVDTWHRASETLKKEVINHFQSTDVLNPVYMMAFSGARGNISQVRQLVGMRGLMADPQGQIIGFPIRSNFREGLTVTEYMISCYGARKGLVDTALRTADAGYLTRRLVDVSQHVIVKIPTCSTRRGIFLKDIKDSGKTLLSLRDRLIGRVLSKDLFQDEKDLLKLNLKRAVNEKGSAAGKTKGVKSLMHLRCKQLEGVASIPFKMESMVPFIPSIPSIPSKMEKKKEKEMEAMEKETGVTPSSISKKFLVASRNQEISPTLATKIASFCQTVLVRSPLTCSAQSGICQMCYGWSLSEGRLVSLGEAVGIVAAQSIGEPGTQLTMRTFHTGGVFSGDVLDEMKSPFSCQVFFPTPLEGVLIRTPQGKIGFLTRNSGQMICINREIEKEVKLFDLAKSTILFVRQNEIVPKDFLLAESSSLENQKNERTEGKRVLFSEISGQVFLDKMIIGKNTDKTGNSISSSRDLGSVWILSSKKCPTSALLPFYAKGSHLVSKETLLSRAQFQNHNHIPWNQFLALNSLQNMSTSFKAITPYGVKEKVDVFPVDSNPSIPLSFPALMQKEQQRWKSENQKPNSLLNFHPVHTIYLRNFGLICLIQCSKMSFLNKTKFTPFTHDKIFFPLKNKRKLKSFNARESWKGPVKSYNSKALHLRSSSFPSYASKMQPSTMEKEAMKKHSFSIASIYNKKAATKKEESINQKSIVQNKEEIESFFWFFYSYRVETGGESWFENVFYNDNKGGGFMFFQHLQLFYEKNNVSLHFYPSLRTKNFSPIDTFFPLILSSSTLSTLFSLCILDATIKCNPVLPVPSSKLRAKLRKSRLDWLTLLSFFLSVPLINRKAPSLLQTDSLTKDAPRRRWVSKGFPIGKRQNLQGLKEIVPATENGWALWTKEKKATNKNEKIFFYKNKISNTTNQQIKKVNQIWKGKEKSEFLRQILVSRTIKLLGSNFIKKPISCSLDFSTTSIPSKVHATENNQMDFFFSAKNIKEKKRWRRNPMQTSQLSPLLQKTNGKPFYPSASWGEKNSPAKRQLQLWINKFKNQLTAENSLSVGDPPPPPYYSEAFTPSIVIPYGVRERCKSKTKSTPEMQKSVTAFLKPKNPFPFYKAESFIFKKQFGKLFKKSQKIRGNYVKNNKSLNSDTRNSLSASLKCGWLYVPKNFSRIGKLHKSYRPFGTGYFEGLERISFEPWMVEIECLPRSLPWYKISHKDQNLFQIRTALWLSLIISKNDSTKIFTHLVKEIPCLQFEKKKFSFQIVSNSKSRFSFLSKTNFHRKVRGGVQKISSPSLNVHASIPFIKKELMERTELTEKHSDEKSLHQFHHRWKRTPFSNKVQKIDQTPFSKTEKASQTTGLDGKGLQNPPAKGSKKLEKKETETLLKFPFFALVRKIDMIPLISQKDCRERFSKMFYENDSNSKSKLIQLKQIKNFSSISEDKNYSLKQGSNRKNSLISFVLSPVFVSSLEKVFLAPVFSPMSSYSVAFISILDGCILDAYDGKGKALSKKDLQISSTQTLGFSSAPIVIWRSEPEKALEAFFEDSQAVYKRKLDKSKRFAVLHSLSPDIFWRIIPISCFPKSKNLSLLGLNVWKKIRKETSDDSFQKIYVDQLSESFEIEKAKRELIRREKNFALLSVSSDIKSSKKRKPRKKRPKLLKSSYPFNMGFRPQLITKKKKNIKREYVRLKKRIHSFYFSKGTYLFKFHILTQKLKDFFVLDFKKDRTVIALSSSFLQKEGSDFLQKEGSKISSSFPNKAFSSPKSFLQKSHSKLSIPSSSIPSFSIPSSSIASISILDGIDGIGSDGKGRESCILDAYDGKGRDEKAHPLLSAFDGEIPCKKSQDQIILNSLFKEGKDSHIYLSHDDYVSFALKGKKPLVSVGQLVLFGEEIGEDLASCKSGQIVSIEKRRISLRKGQSVLFYAGGFSHVSHGQYLPSNSPLLTLTYKRLITGDIVQGIPKIEQFFEAPITKDGEPLLNSLAGKLQQFFLRFRKNLSLPLAVRESISSIQEFVVEGIQKVYLSQGVLISDKHIEVIVRQMTSKVKILTGGKTGLLPGEYINLQKIESINLSTRGDRADYGPVILGITQASLDSESFISAASFQETTRVLSRDSLQGKTDFLRGLKERVVLGDLIQAGTGLDENLAYGLATKGISFFPYVPTGDSAEKEKMDEKEDFLHIKPKLEGSKKPFQPSEGFEASFNSVGNENEGGKSTIEIKFNSKMQQRSWTGLPGLFQQSFPSIPSIPSIPSKMEKEKEKEKEKESMEKHRPFRGKEGKGAEGDEGQVC